MNKSQGQKRELITLFHKKYSSFCYNLFYLCFDVHCNNKKMVSNFRQKNGIKIVQKCAKAFWTDYYIEKSLNPGKWIFFFTLVIFQLSSITVSYNITVLTLPNCCSEDTDTDYNTKPLYWLSTTHSIFMSHTIASNWNGRGREIITLREFTRNDIFHNFFF